jgi:hypothetical protein
MSFGKATREHVILEHVIETDAQSACEQDGDQAKDQSNDINASGE